MAYTVVCMSEEIEALLGFGVFHLNVSCDISQESYVFVTAKTSFSVCVSSDMYLSSDKYTTVHGDSFSPKVSD